MKKAILLMAGMLALSVLAESFELVNGSLATNEMKVVMDKAGDHLTLVGSTLTVTNEFVTIDRDSSFDLRRGRLFIGITNSTLTSIDKGIEFTAYSASGNTTRVDVVNSTFNATNAAPGLLSLGVFGPNATWQERIFFHATNSTFNLSAFRGYGALNALFECCTLTFDDNIPTGSGFGPGSATSTDAADVVFRDCYITNWTLRFGDYVGAAPSKVTIDGGETVFRNIVQAGKSPGHLVLTNGAACRIKKSYAEEHASDLQYYWDFAAANGTNLLEIADNSSLQLDYPEDASKLAILRIAYAASSRSVWRLHGGGTFDDARNGRPVSVYWGYNGTADMHLEDGGTFKTYHLYMGAIANTSGTKLRSNIYQTGGLYWACRVSTANVEADVVLAYRGGHDCRYHLDGGVLKTPRLYGGAGAEVNDGTGWAQLSANGGTLKPGADSRKYALVSLLDRAECGPMGLTVDTAEYGNGAVIAQEFTNREGENGLFRKVGEHELALALPGRCDWDVSETRVEGGSLVVSNAATVMKTTLVVTNGATFSMQGAATMLTLDGLSVPYGTIALDPGDKITVPASGLSLGNLAITFSSTLNSDAEADVFLCEGEVSESNLRRIRDAITSSGAVPAGHCAKVETTVEGGVTHVRLKVAEQSARLTDSTTWQGAEDAWQTAGSWTAGVAEFPQSAALKSITVPHAAPVGAVRFTGGGYELSGGALAVSGERGEAVIANEAGSNTIGASMTFADIVEITNAPNTTLTLAGPITGGGFEKTGDGRLELGASNELGDIVALSGGRTVVSDAAAFGTDEGFTTRVTLGAGTLEFGEALGEGVSVDGAFLINTPVNTRGVAMWAATNVTVAAPSSKNGAFIKAGPGRLTMLVSGDTTLVAQSVHDRTPYPNQYFAIGEDGLLPDNSEKSAQNNTYFAGVNIYEGELLLKAAPGADAPTVEASAASTVIGMHTDGASATPTLTMDGVVYDAGTLAFYANGYNLNNKYGFDYEFVPSLFQNRLNIVNGGMLKCGTFYATQYGGSNGDMKPVITMTNGTISASALIYFAHSSIGHSSHNENALATLNAKSSTISAPAYTVDGHVASDFDGSTLCAAAADGYATFKGAVGAYGKMLFRGGSVFRVGTLDFSSEFKDASPTRVFTLAFDDAEWQYGDGDYTLGSSVVDENHATNFVIRMEGKGVVLKPASGTTFTTELPFQGEGGMVVDGPGTVAFAADTVKFSGVAEVKQGTLDLSAAGTVSGIGVKGPGTVRGATLVNPTISLEVDDEWGVAGVPVFDGCAISGRVRVDCGRTEENPLAMPGDTPVVVARFSGSAPDVSGWRLLGSGVPGVHGVFSVQSDTVVMTVSKPGFTLIVR